MEIRELLRWGKLLGANYMQIWENRIRNCREITDFLGTINPFSVFLANFNQFQILRPTTRVNLQFE